MPERLTVASAIASPELTTYELRWRDEPIQFRPLRPDDRTRLFEYFQGLSAETRYLYHPHPFTEEYAERLCAQNGAEQTVRMIALREHEASSPALAYVILDFGLSAEDMQRYRGYDVQLERPICRIGPSVSDACRGRGLGTVLMEALGRIALRFGCTRIILLGGVFTINERAIGFYQKVGFRKMGRYGIEEGPESWDMMKELRPSPCLEAAP